MAPPPKTAERPSKPPQKRPAHTSQDTTIHPPKKQRLEAATVAKVAGAGAGAGAAGKVKRKEGEKVVGGKKAGKGLIETAPTTAAGSTTEMVPVAVPRTNGTTKGAAVPNPVVATKNDAPSAPNKTAPSRNKAGPLAQPQPAKQTAKNAPKPGNTSKPSPSDNAPPAKQLHTARRMQPMKPLTSDGQHVLGRPKAASGAGPTGAVEGRNVVFVTRKTGLGSYMRRCKALLVDDGLNQITLHALCVAIPHAVMLLYALVDILPFPKKYIHHEIQTSSVECHDEMSFVAGLEGKGKGKALAIFEEDEAGIRARAKSGIRITIRIGKGARVSAAEHETPTDAGKSSKARPNKVQRVARRQDAEEDEDMGEAVEEEERMNEDAPAVATIDQTRQKGKSGDAGPRKQGKTGNVAASGKKQKSGGGKQKPRSSAVAMDVD